MMKTRVAITGIHGYVPEYVLTNDTLEKMVDTSDDWIITRTGIKERRILKEEGKGSSFMGIKAVEGLLEKTNTDPKEIDLLICATITPDLIFPATGNIISHAVGAVNAFSYDIQAACSGFIYAIVTGAQFIETGKYKKVVVVGVDKMSSIIDYKDRATCVIFGDGAGAALLESNEEGLGIIDSILKTNGSGEKYLYQKAGGSRRPPTRETIDAREHYLYQDGKNVFKFAIHKVTSVSRDIMKNNNLSSNDIDFLVPHQANIRIIEAIIQRLGISKDKAMVTIDKFGNTTAASIPLCLWRYESKLKKGDKLILSAFGGGFTWGSIYIKWAYDGC